MLMIHEWRHTKMLKRAGRAFDPGGIDATPEGGLAIPCRACPQPRMNLPRGWDQVARGKECVCLLHNYAHFA